MSSFCRPCPGATALAVLQSKALPFYDTFFNNPLPYLLSSPTEALEMSDFPSSSPSSSSPLRQVEDMDEDSSASTTVVGGSERFTAEEEARLLAAAHLQKASGNTLFATQHYLAAIDAYNLALRSTPTYLSHETAILHSNLAACHLKLSAPTLALEHAGDAIARRPGWTKPLLRRCKAREMLGSWKELERAVEEYEALLRPQPRRTDGEADLTDAERRECARSLARCRKTLEEVRAKEVGDAMKGLKSLGDGLLRPFGISTSDFGMKPDGKGGYSLQFQRGGGGGQSA